MSRIAEILEYQPHPSGGFVQRDASGTSWCSSDGMDQMVQIARIEEHWAEHLEAAKEALSLLCAEHHRSIAEFAWDVNDYVCNPLHDPAHIDFMLSGFHDDGPFCLPAIAHSVPAGLVIEVTP